MNKYTIKNVASVMRKQLLWKHLTDRLSSKKKKGNAL